MRSNAMCWIDMRLDQATQLIHGEKMLVAAADVAKPRLDRPGSRLFAIFVHRICSPRRQDGVIVSHVYRVEAVTDGDHLLMDFFTRTHADDPKFTLWPN